MVRILAVGCGGIGGTLAATFGRGEGVRVVGLSTNAAIASAVGEHGFRLSDRGAPVVATVGEVVAEPARDERFDFVLLATQPPQVEAAARSALPWLAPDGAMVVFQNGLCEERIAAIVGADRTLGAVVRHLHPRHHRRRPARDVARAHLRPPAGPRDRLRSSFRP